VNGKCVSKCKKGSCKEVGAHWDSVRNVCIVAECRCEDCSTYWECWKAWTGIECKSYENCREKYGTEYEEATSWYVYKIDPTKNTKEKCEPLPNVEVSGYFTKRIKIREIKPFSKVDVNISDFIIRNISIRSRTELRDVSIEIRTVYSWEIERLKIEKPKEKVYEYLNITIQNVSSNSIEEIELEFRVSKYWINSSNINESSVVLLRFHENKWNELSTWKAGEDKDYLYYKAKTTFFSIFAIAGKEKLQLREEKLTSTIVGMPLKEEKEAKAETQATEENLSGKEEDWVYALIGLIFVIMILTGLYFALRKIIAFFLKPSKRRRK